jgi:hypothetical protein
MMVRMQVTLDPETHRSILETAARQRISASEYIRRAVLKTFEEPPSPADPSRVFDLGRSTGTDIARDKAALLGEAAASLRRPTTRTAIG